MNTTLTMEGLSRLIRESIEEAFKSKKLSDFAKEHGGMEYQRWSSDFANDLYNMSDEDFDEYVAVDPEQHYTKYGINGYDKNDYTNNNFQPIEFGDGTFMVRKNPQRAWDERAQAMINKRFDRWKNKQGDGKNRYRFENPYINKLVNGYSDRDYPARGYWGYEGDNGLSDTQLNPKAIRQRDYNEKPLNDKGSMTDRAKKASQRKKS